MMASKQLGQFDALGLDAVADLFSFLRKRAKGQHDIYRLRKPGIVKAYYECELVIAVHFDVPLPPHKLSFVFARVPMRDGDGQLFDANPLDGGGISFERSNH